MFEGKRGVFSTFPYVLSRCELSDSHKLEKKIQINRGRTCTANSCHSFTNFTQFLIIFSPQATRRGRR